MKDDQKEENEEQVRISDNVLSERARGRRAWAAVFASAGKLDKRPYMSESGIG